MYSGVGAIGLSVGASVLVESDDANIKLAQSNAKGSGVEVIHATSEAALNHIQSGDVLIVDPPRAGLHKDVVERILEVKPSKIIYLSCNPSTQARDVTMLHDMYEVIHAQGHNFFPRTPHIESLVVLKLI
jgi:23S rRNA (uracil1939-C5)-methyltransferase